MISLSGIASFKAATDGVAPSGTDTLTWTVSGGTSLILDNGIGAVTGTSMAKQAQATHSLYMVGALFFAFILIVLLIVQIRIERHVRALSLRDASS